jgi:hypothetical protein
MANIIKEVIGREALVNVTPNPFAFFLLYSKAAKKKGQEVPSFSKKSIRFLKYLEKKYVK